MKSNHRIKSIIFLFFTFFLTACQTSWEIELSTGDQANGKINQADVAFYVEKSLEETEIVPLGQLFFQNNFTLIDKIELTSASGESQIFTWDDIAENTTISQAGAISIGDQRYNVDSIAISPSPQLNKISHSIMDIAPTIAYAMELPELPESKGQVHLTYSGAWDHAVMIFLDGLQYDVLTSLIDAEKLPFFEKLDMMRQGITVYPPITTSASAALLTGTPPKDNGVYGYGYRTTTSTTLFDLFVQNGKSVAAVEGSGLAFNLRNAETILSGDRDNNGFTNDNVYENSLEIIHSDMPDLLYIHFHDIDNMGHKFGPLSSEYETSIIQVDNYLEEIINALPEGTLITIFADHGMHTTEDGGNHGTLTAADLIIPIIFIEK